MKVIQRIGALKDIKARQFLIVGAGQAGAFLYKFIEKQIKLQDKLYIEDTTTKVIITDRNIDKIIQFENGISELELEQRNWDDIAVLISIQSQVAAEQWVEKLGLIGIPYENMYHYSYSPRTREEFFLNGYYRNGVLVPLLRADSIMAEKIQEGVPFLAARWGTTEGAYMLSSEFGFGGYAKALQDLSGVFPYDDNETGKFFTEVTRNAAKDVDYLLDGVWCKELEFMRDFYCPEAELSRFATAPSNNSSEYIKALEGKRVLIIHPFAYLMKEQYKKRELLFSTPELPEFTLVPYQAVQSLGGLESPDIKNWKDALLKMERDISLLDFDVALLGCGAYGMPLGSYIKSKLKKAAIHIGGSLQLFFGIKGARWDDSGIYNEYWVRPSDDLKPQNYSNVEGGCYW